MTKHPFLRWLLLGTALLGRVAWSAEPPAPPNTAVDEFHFVVLGDSQFDDPVAANRLYDDIRWLQPAFVIQVGDMIGGYGSPTLLRAEWQRFRRQLAGLTAAGIPFLPVPGNHDVFGPGKAPDAESLAIYEAEWGSAYYDFRYRNTHFIVLNSDPVGADNDLDADQLRWLEERLEAAASATHRLVLLHRPPAFLGASDRFHELMVDHAVSHVFYGHHHHYHQRERDGVTYVMTNGTGNSGTRIDRAGSFDHLLQVSVRDDQLDYAIVRADAIEAPGFAVPEDNYELFGLQRNLSRLKPELIPEAGTGDEPRRFSTRLEFSNPSRRTVTLHVHCTSADERYRFEPARLKPLELPPKEARTLPLTVIEQQPSEATPNCSVQFPFQTHDGRWHLPEVVVELNLPSAESEAQPGG